MTRLVSIISKRNTFIAIAICIFSSISLALTCEQVVQKQKVLLENEIKEARIEFKTIASPQAAFAAIIKMVREAQHSLDFSTYIIKSDEAGRIIIGELLKAAQRGVRVRLLVDSFGSIKATQTDLKILLSQSNVEIVSFNSLTQWLRYPKTFIGWLLDTFGFAFSDRSTDKLFHNRLHDKIIISDRGHSTMLVMIGGRNAGEEYFGIGKSKNSKQTFLDLNVLIRPKDSESNFSQDLNNYFESLFYHQTNQLLVQKKFNLFSSEEKTQIEIRKAIENNRWLDEALDLMAQTQYFDQNFESGTLKMVHELQNITQKKNLFDFKTLHWKSKANPNSVLKSLREEFRKAKKKIRIVTPYMILSERDIIEIEKSMISNPNLEVEFFTNSIKSTNHVSAQLILEAVVLPRLKSLIDNPLIGSRLKIYLYNPKQPAENDHTPIEARMHTKLVEIDGNYLVTSSNFDLISRFSNSELGFWLKPDTQIRDLESYITRLEHHSVRYGSPEWNQSEINPVNQSWTTLKKYFSSFIQKFHLTILKIF